MSTGRGTLDRTRVVAAAIALADEQGFAALSMRRLAETLAVTPMALYKHVANREQLVDEMIDRLLADLPTPPPAGPWKRALRTRILHTRRALAAHGWAREAIETRTTAGPGVLAYLDSLMATMFAGGLTPHLVHQAMHALSTRMWGFTRDVVPTPRLPDEPDARERVLADAAATYPSIARMAGAVTSSGGGCDADAEFAFALDLILDGVERRHRAGWTP